MSVRIQTPFIYRIFLSTLYLPIYLLVSALRQLRRQISVDSQGRGGRFDTPRYQVPTTEITYHLTFQFVQLQSNAATGRLFELTLLPKQKFQSRSDKLHFIRLLVVKLRQQIKLDNSTQRPRLFSDLKICSSIKVSLGYYSRKRVLNSYSRILHVYCCRETKQFQEHHFSSRENT